MSKLKFDEFFIYKKHKVCKPTIRYRAQVLGIKNKENLYTKSEIKKIVNFRLRKKEKFLILESKINYE